MFNECRFNYTYYDKKQGPIYKSIEALDRNGMSIIEAGNPDAFKEYLSEYDNTICGRHPIAVFMHVISLSLPFATFLLRFRFRVYIFRVRLYVFSCVDLPFRI